MDTLTIGNGDAYGSIDATFVPSFLGGAVNYTFDGWGEDRLIIEGNGNGGSQTDAFLVTNAAFNVPLGSLAVTDLISGVVVTATVAPGELLLDTKEGDDTVIVDDSNGLIGSLITYDGGAGSDTLIVDGGDIQSATYSPGPAVTEGRLTHDGQTIDFVNLEPVIDLTNAGMLTVNGTNADDAINYIQGPNSNTHRWSATCQRAWYRLTASKQSSSPIRRVSQSTVWLATT